MKTDTTAYVVDESAMEPFDAEAEYGKNWPEECDTTTRRKIQNRLASQRHHEKMKRHGEDPEQMGSWVTPGYVSEEIPWLQRPPAPSKDKNASPQPERLDPESSPPKADIYSPLDGPDSIRILEIREGTGSDLSTSLKSISLNEGDLHYEALSYTWASNSGGTWILCNGKRKAVRPNLDAALRQLRLPDRPRLVWVDALCINQNDPQERGHQVRLMRSIYKRAARVIVWLGNDRHGMAEAAFALICHLANGRFLLVHQPAFFTRADGSTSPGPSGELPPASSADWRPVAALFAIDWFWRLWVVQEIVMSRAAVVLWGGTSIDWRWIASSAARIRNAHFPLVQEHQMYGVFNAYFMYRMSATLRQTDPLELSFLRLLTLTRQFEVSDLRDRVYGLLGLKTTDADPENGELFLQPNYEISSEKLYCDLARKVLQVNRSLKLLSAVQHGPSIPTGLPSWVPEWHSAYTHMITPSDPDSCFNASAGAPPMDSNVDESFSLTLGGMEVDHVIKLIRPLPDDPLLSTGLAYVSEVQALLKTQTGLEPLALTLTAGKDWYGALVEGKDSAAHAADFRAWLLASAATDNESSKLANLLGPHASLASSEDLDPRRFWEAASYACNGRTLFTTRTGCLGLGPAAMREGDVVCVLFGGTVPYILRPKEDHYLFVGECYVKDLMSGEALANVDIGERQDRNIIIIC